MTSVKVMNEYILSDPFINCSGCNCIIEIRFENNKRYKIQEYEFDGIFGDHIDNSKKCLNCDKVSFHRHRKFPNQFGR